MNAPFVLGEHLAQDLKDVGAWLGVPAERLVLSVSWEPLGTFLRQIEEMESSYPEFPQDERRTARIYRLLRRGAHVLPIYVEAQDPDSFVMEGRHRMVAFRRMGMQEIPVCRVSKAP